MGRAASISCSSTMGNKRADSELFRAAMQGVKRLAPAPLPPELPAAPSRKIAAAARPPASPAGRQLPPLALGESAGIDRASFDLLRRGQLPIEARLDLHGLTQEEAHRDLTRFIATSDAAGKRLVLVITGKGRPGSEGMGVLRQAVPRWLNEPSLRGRILALTPAQPRDGGAGALYVLLRRKRAP
jgi:DNA-nicking Smr family endonuclease